MKWFLCLIAAGFLFSCTGSGKHYPRYDSFPVEKALCTREVPLDTALFRYPFRVTVKKGMAIVMDLHNADHYYHAFTYPGWEHVASFGKRGEAPEEMLSAETFQFNSLDSIWALDANKMQLTRWSVSPASRLAKLDEQIPLEGKLVRSLDFYAMDSCFLVPDYLGESRYSEVDYQGKWIRSHGSLPSETADEYTSLPALAQAWRSFIDYNPANGILAFVTQLGEVLEIYDLNNQSHHVVYGPQGEPEFQTAGTIGIPTGIMGFSDIQVTGQYIYALFHGTKFKDIIQAGREGKTLESGGRYIYVFDLKGNPVRKYTLDRHIMGFHIHEAQGQLIALDVNSNQPIVICEL